MTFDGIRRLSPYWSLALCYGVVTAVGLIPGLRVVESGADCCGIAGTYGLKAEKYEVARAVGKGLFEMVLATNRELAACDTETCRWQITGATGVPTVHPISLVHRAYGLEGAVQDARPVPRAHPLHS